MTHAKPKTNHRSVRRRRPANSVTKPVPTRFDEEELADLRAVSAMDKVSMADIIRSGTRHEVLRRLRQKGADKSAARRTLVNRERGKVQP